MAFTKVSQDKRKQDQTTVQYDPNTGSTTITKIETWNAVSNSITDNTVSAAFATDGTNTIPLAGDIYTFGGIGLYCTQVYPKRTAGSPFAFEVQVTYSITITPVTGGTSVMDLDVSLSSVKVIVPTEKDKDGNTIKNLAGDTYSPGLSRTYYDEKIDISFKTTSPTDYRTYLGKVNSDSCTFAIKALSRSYSARQLLFADATLSSSIPLTGGTPVWEVHLVFYARQDTFVSHVKEQGYYQLSGGNYVPCVDHTGLPATQPQLLASDGSQATFGASPIYTDWKIETEVAFSGLFSF